MTKYLCRDILDIVLAYSVIDITILSSYSRELGFLLRQRKSSSLTIDWQTGIGYLIWS